MARLAYNLNTKLPDQSHFHPETKAEYIDDEGDNVLDDRILERPTSGMSHDMNQRRESFAEAASAISPRQNRWSDFTFSSDTTSQLHSSNMTSPIFFDQNAGHGFVHDDSMNGQMYGHPSAAWPLPAEQDSYTPTTAYDAFPADQDIKGLVPGPHNESMNVSLQGVYGGLPVPQPAGFYGGNMVSQSPRSGQDWSSISSAEHSDMRSGPRPGVQSSPSSYNHNPPLLRRDGIRKKNARFEIPAERTLRTIDTLINNSTDEAQIKELKQQKRLLRNRQAALDSRQRKKQHTERLEEEKKNSTGLISEMEEALEAFKIREDAWTHEKNEMVMHLQQQQHYINELLSEKEEIIRRHTLETGELRKKNAYLVDQAEKAEMGIAMSAVPSSTGYSTEYGDFDNLTMESSPWDNFSLVNDFGTMDAETQHTNALAIMPKKERTTVKQEREESDTSTATAPGLLLMLLLCGAWVVSNGDNHAATKSNPVARMPEDVRLASTTVLSTIYNETGLQSQPTQTHRNPAAVVPFNRTPTTTATPTTAPRTRHSPLASLHSQLISPSDQQRHDNLFSLSADSYNNIASASSSAAEDQKHVSPRGRRNLGEALAAVRLGKRGSAAEVYTRSLMWDQIPGDVVREFARMVGEAREERQEPLQ